MAMMQTDLANIVTVQEVHHAEHQTYASDISELTFFSSAGVTIKLSAATSVGFRATASHSGRPHLRCYLELGSAWQERDGTHEAEPWCDD